MRRAARTALSVLAVALALPAFAGQVYTWKDAKGVTHYADAPPPGQALKARAYGERAAPEAPKAAVNANCSNARSNLTLLQGSGKIGVDDDRDGKVDRELTPAERAGRLKVAQGEVEMYCDQPVADAAMKGA